MSTLRVKSEIDDVEKEEGFYIMDIEIKQNITCQIQYNNNLYTFKYPENYPASEPNIQITNLETQETMPFVFGKDEWSNEWSTLGLILTLDANMNENAQNYGH